MALDVLYLDIYTILLSDWCRNPCPGEGYPDKNCICQCKRPINLHTWPENSDNPIVPCEGEFSVTKRFPRSNLKFVDLNI